jgi:phenylalanine-4-hydroxylase
MDSEIVAMTVQDTIAQTPTFTEQDHETWSKLHERQMELVKDRACSWFLEGYPKLQLDPHRLPDPQVVSKRVEGMTGWMLGDAQDAYLGPTEWFEHVKECRFPVTNYIRKPHEIDFTPLPDLFHEYFGHLGFFTNQRFADDAQLFGQLYLSAKTEKQQLAIARLWWFTTEFGLIRENGETRIFGAGLLSSPGELIHALEPSTPRYDFDIAQVTQTASAPYGYHEAYWVLDGYDHVRHIVFDYAKLEGLPEPKPLR